ncbi:hypothetical protein KUCAC02_000186, partial [Chaenocephalus aceratus]
ASQRLFGFLNEINVGSATSAGSHPAVLLSGLNKIIAGKLRARQSGVNCSDPQPEARPHLPGETIPKSASVSRMLTKSLEERFCEEALNDGANQHYVQDLTGTQTRLFEGVCFQRDWWQAKA